ncbi:MAG: hypothetical protein FD126_3198, partial [Elusimicrobia bacterium]
QGAYRRIRWDSPEVLEAYARYAAVLTREASGIAARPHKLPQ